MRRGGFVEKPIVFSGFGIGFIATRVSCFVA